MENTKKKADITNRGRKIRTLGFFGKYGTLIGLAFMIILFTALKPNAFPTVRNFLNILNQGSLLAILAFGSTVVLIVNEFDLSPGFIASFAGVLVSGFMVIQHFPIGLAIVLVLFLCLILGLISGLVVTRLRVSSVIATIGTGGIILGLNYAYANGAPIATGIPDWFLNITLFKVFGVIPSNVAFMFALMAILWVLLNKTELGQRIQAVGGNAQAAELAGINVSRIKIIAFMIGSFCAGLTGILLASVIGSGTTNAGDAYMINAFAAVFLGSATLKEGEFHILGTFIGVLIINIGFNGLAIFGVPTFFQHIFQGVILIGAVALSSVSRMYAKK